MIMNIEKKYIRMSVNEEDNVFELVCVQQQVQRLAVKSRMKLFVQIWPNALTKQKEAHVSICFEHCEQ
jgi:hypothetical protein